MPCPSAGGNGAVTNGGVTAVSMNRKNAATPAHTPTTPGSSSGRVRAMLRTAASV